MDSLSNLSDEELLKEIDEQNRSEILGILYDRFENKVFHKALSVVKDVAEARDLTHDIFIRVFTKLHQFKGKSAFSLWVHSISVNYCLSYIQKKRKVAMIEISDEVEMVHEDTTQRELMMLEEIKISQLRDLLNRLDPSDRLLLTMKYFDGMSIHDMEAILDLKVSAVKMRLLRARSKLLELYHKNSPHYE